MWASQFAHNSGHFAVANNRPIDRRLPYAADAFRRREKTIAPRALLANKAKLVGSGVFNCKRRLS
jgi:hypothetical protein